MATLIEEETHSSLEAMLREGARRMLQSALEMEVEAYIERCQAQRDGEGQRLVVRNGHHRTREVVTGVGKIAIRQPRIHDRRAEHHFTSAILPPYLRRTPSIDALIPALYLKGVSTSQFPEALSAILGEGVSGLSPANIVRLKALWDDEYQRWCRRDLTDKHYVYIWADGLYFNVRLAADRPCVLVVIGATRDGCKELIAIEDGQRESKLSWQALLQGPQSPGADPSPGGGRRRWGVGLLGGVGGGIPGHSSRNGVGCIKRPMRWMLCPKVNSPRPRN